jgi:hypothetical protein
MKVHATSPYIAWQDLRSAPEFCWATLWAIPWAEAGRGKGVSVPLGPPGIGVDVGFDMGAKLTRSWMSTLTVLVLVFVTFVDGIVSSMSQAGRIRKLRTRNSFFMSNPDSRNRSYKGGRVRTIPDNPASRVFGWGARTIVDYSDLNEPRTASPVPFDDWTLYPVQEFEIPKVLGCALESRPMEEIIPTIVASNETKTFLDLTNLPSH